jgi:hypothetical protein
MSRDFSKYFSSDYFIVAYKLIDFANRCAICRPDPRSGAGARMVTSDKSFWMGRPVAPLESSKYFP